MTLSWQSLLSGWPGKNLRKKADAATSGAAFRARGTAVTRAPVALADGATVFVEAVAVLEDTLLVAGWSTDAEFAFSLDTGVAGPPSECWRQDREDVRAQYGSGTGFVLTARSGTTDGALVVRPSHGTTAGTRLALGAKPLTEDIRRMAGKALSTLLRNSGAEDLARRDAVRKALPWVTSSKGTSIGFLEGLLLAEDLGCGLLFGWVQHAPADMPWLEIDGRYVPLSEAFRFQRRDVEAIIAPGARLNQQPGFVLRLDGVTATSRVKLVTAVDEGKIILGETTVTSVLPRKPADAVRMLLSVETPLEALSARLRKVDVPLIEALQKAWLKTDKQDAVWEKTFGAAVSEPEISIIVPVYGSFAFFQNQVVKLCDDPEVRKRCEIIYVLDDPRLTDPFLQQSAFLSRLWDVAFRVVGNGQNNGFSGANNLGVSVARGSTFLFMNSDVLPIGPGWLGSLRAALLSDKDAGIVAPQLLYADGGVQHAGMTFDYNDTLGIWTNQHPGKGLLPELLGETLPRAVEAVTGACLMIDRKLFETVGGWDITYIIGDFEDSDLCLKVTAQGRACVYVPGVKLTHLERQSFHLGGRDDLNLRVTILNATLHQQRWADRMPAHGGQR